MLWGCDLVSFREFDTETGIPIRFHQTCTTQAFLAWADRALHTSQTGYFQFDEADRLQEIAAKERMKHMMEFVDDEALVTELRRRGYRVEAIPKLPKGTITIKFTAADMNAESPKKTKKKQESKKVE